MTKKKRNKRYRPKRYIGILLGGESFPFAPAQLDDMERNLRIHAAVLRTEPAESSWLYILGMLAAFYRLAAALEGSEARRLFLAGWRKTYTAYRHWQETSEILTANLATLDDCIETGRAMMPNFTIYEFRTASDWMNMHGIEPPKENEECEKLLPRLQSH